MIFSEIKPEPFQARRLDLITLEPINPRYCRSDDPSRLPSQPSISRRESARVLLLLLLLLFFFSGKKSFFFPPNRASSIRRARSRCALRIPLTTARGYPFNRAAVGRLIRSRFDNLLRRCRGGKTRGTFGRQLPRYRVIDSAGEAAFSVLLARGRIFYFALHTDTPYLDPYRIDNVLFASAMYRYVSLVIALIDITN